MWYDNDDSSLRKASASRPRYADCILSRCWMNYMHVIIARRILQRCASLTWRPARPADASCCPCRRHSNMVHTSRRVQRGVTHGDIGESPPGEGQHSARRPPPKLRCRFACIVVEIWVCAISDLLESLKINPKTDGCFRYRPFNLHVFVGMSVGAR